jgi:hypothetical protein
MNGHTQAAPTEVVEAVATRFATEGALSTEDKHALIECDAHFLIIAAEQRHDTPNAPCPYAALARRIDDPWGTPLADAPSLPEDERAYLRILSTEPLTPQLRDAAPPDVQAALDLFSVHRSGTPDESEVITTLSRLRPGPFRIVVTGLVLRGLLDTLPFSAVARISADLVLLNRRHQLMMERWNEITLARTREAIPTITAVISTFNSDRVVRSLRLSRLVDVLDRQLTVLENLPRTSALDTDTLDILDQSVRDIATGLYGDTP